MISPAFRPVPADRVVDHKDSIWMEFAKLAAAHKAVNIGQGFPDSPAPKFVTNILKKISSKPEMTTAHQYTRGYGHPELVDILADMYSYHYNANLHSKYNVLVTVGACHALFYSFLGWINPGDEVIIIEPAFDCYFPQIKLAGGIPIAILMTLKKDAICASDFTIDFKDLESKICDKTKMLVINNPHNPTGKLFSRDELEKLAEIAKKYNLIVIADEVYEYHVYKKEDMIRFASLPGMYDRTISIGSAGKAFSITGWKLGWAIGSQRLLAPLKAIHQNCVGTCSTPTQLAVAKAFQTDWPKFLENPKKSYLASELSGECLIKRNKMVKMLLRGGFRPIVPEAGYFMLANYLYQKHNINMSHEMDPADFVFARWLCSKKKLAVIPFSAFYSDQDDKRENSDYIRFCFFKKDKTLRDAKKIFEELGECRFREFIV